ncbi:hypothetical protein HY212_03000 [Candidatus Pacearchaeota archaeon]|nr:hypothetical protein [Candidatus Pacearchaeota archaeon]
MMITIITGWIAAILLLFNFITCFALPFASKHAEPCQGRNCANCRTFGSYHKPIVWMTILAVAVHIGFALAT